jgi:hypothetical protein
MLGLAEMAWKLACKRTHQVSTYQGFPEVSREDCDDLTTIHNEYYRIIDELTAFLNSGAFLWTGTYGRPQLLLASLGGPL